MGWSYPTDGRLYHVMGKCVTQCLVLNKCLAVFTEANCKWLGKVLVKERGEGGKERKEHNTDSRLQTISRASWLVPSERGPQLPFALENPGPNRCPFMQKTRDLTKQTKPLGTMFLV